MDENPQKIQQQSSIGSDTNSEESGRLEGSSDKRTICLVGGTATDAATVAAAQSFGVNVISIESGSVNSCGDAIYVLDSFEGSVFDTLYKARKVLLGPPALQQLSSRNEELPNNTRPLYNLAMTGVVVCFTGFRNKDDLSQLVMLVHHMGGSIRKDMSAKVTHLIANCTGGEKYEYAETFRLPAMHLDWVLNSWKKRNEIDFTAASEAFVTLHKLKPFHGARVCFVGFSEEDEKDMIEVLKANGGTITNMEDSACTHVVMDASELFTMDTADLPPTSPQPPHQSTPIRQNATDEQPKTPPNMTDQEQEHLATLKEQSREHVMDMTDCDDISLPDLPDLNTSSTTRKRKFLSPERIELTSTKRNKRDLSYSESNKATKRISRMFKTPLNYFSQRRRTIGDALANNDSFNSSIVSSSGVFEVNTVQNLNESCSSDFNQTPLDKKLQPRKSLFTRTFSSAKLTKKSKRTTLNATKLSFTEGSECDGASLNSSCFPDLCERLTSARVVPACSSQSVPSPSSPLPTIIISEPPPTEGVVVGGGGGYAGVCRSTDGRTSRGAAGLLTHTAVIDESAISERHETQPKAYVVKAEWFWTSVQKETCLPEKDYRFEGYHDQILSPNTRRDSHAPTSTTPSSASRRKRKRLHETLSSLAAGSHPLNNHHHHLLHPSPLFAHSHNKRRSSVSDAGLLSVSGSFLDCTASPDKDKGGVGEAVAGVSGVGDGSGVAAVTGGEVRKVLSARHQVFQELVQTESNYVNILYTIITMFKKHLEDMPESDALLNNTELKIIFGRVPAIYETHLRMLDDLRATLAAWTEDHRVGHIILRYATDLLHAYPPFVNAFEDMKETLTGCDAAKPRFHAFLKACQTRPECGRQGLQDLMIRPVQRLPSISLLLNDILKHTPKSHADHSLLVQALASIKEVMTHINEDKRKAEGQRVMFDIFNEIDNCPPDLVSSHRSFVAKCEVVQLSSSDGLSGKGSPLVLFLFSDQLEVCKKRSKAFNSIKSPNTANGGNSGHAHSLGYKTTGSSSSTSSSAGSSSASKPYKHVKLMSLSTIKRVIDIKETNECQRVFSFIFRNNDEVKEKLFSFAMTTDEEEDKTVFLRTLCRQMATNACTADSDKFLVTLEPHQLDIDTSYMHNGTLSKAFKFANRTRLKVGRAFSFNKTPSKLKRAVSSMMSPFGSSTNLTPASQLAQMRLASYSNISELGHATNADAPMAPMSVQPTRKHKTSSLGVNALKRL